MIDLKTRKSRIFGLMILILLLGGAIAVGCANAGKTETLQDETKLEGNWTGESICQVKNSPCRDEKVIYHVSAPDANGKVTVQADKIVDGKPEDMGTIDFKYDKANKTLVGETPHGAFKFTVNGNKMEGVLNSTDGTLYRKISLKKDEK